MFDKDDRAYLQAYRKIITSLSIKNNISKTQLELLIFMYNYRYVTWEHLYRDFYVSRNFIDKKMPDMKRKGFIDNYPQSKKFRQIRKYYITQKGRLLVARIYRMIEEDEQIPDVYNREKKNPWTYSNHGKRYE